VHPGQGYVRRQEIGRVIDQPLQKSMRFVLPAHGAQGQRKFAASLEQLWVEFNGCLERLDAILHASHVTQQLGQSEMRRCRVGPQRQGATETKFRLLLSTCACQCDALAVVRAWVVACSLDRSFARCNAVPARTQQRLTKEYPREGERGIAIDQLARVCLHLAQPIGSLQQMEEPLVRVELQRVFFQDPAQHLLRIVGTTDALQLHSLLEQDGERRLGVRSHTGNQFRIHVSWQLARHRLLEM